MLFRKKIMVVLVLVYKCRLKKLNNLYYQVKDRATIKHIACTIKARLNLWDIKTLFEGYLLRNGADSFWYWDVGAFVFAGDETAISVSGKDYKVANRTIQENDIIMIDLSPQKDSIWGNYARTFVIENGIVCDEIDEIKKDEWRNGLQMETYLHKTLVDVTTSYMAFEELYYYMNDLIVKKGFLTLDFLGNLGYSIVKNKKTEYISKRGIVKDYPHLLCL